MLKHKLIERLLANQCLSDLLVVEREELPWTVQKKATSEEPYFNQGQSFSSELSSNAKDKDLEVI